MTIHPRPFSFFAAQVNRLIRLLPCIVLSMSQAQETPPPGVENVSIISSIDQAPGDAWFAPAPTEEPAPLLVHLHSWSGHFNRSAGVVELAKAALQRGWAFLSPDFRGPNDRPEACASPLAIQDILDAVAFAEDRTSIDPQRIYLIGGSGGGHMALTMATAAPTLWAAVSAWVPITDLAAWHAFSQSRGFVYHRMLEKVCGGAPGSSPEVDRQYHIRSPLFRLETPTGLPIDLQVGIHDGHGTAQVPASHTLHAFNRLAIAYDSTPAALSETEVEAITRDAHIPADLRTDAFTPENDRQHPILLRRQAGPVRLTIFDGAHETDFPTALQWLETQTKPARGY